MCQAVKITARQLFDVGILVKRFRQFFECGEKARSHVFGRFLQLPARVWGKFYGVHTVRFLLD